MWGTLENWKLFSVVFVHDCCDWLKCFNSRKLPFKIEYILNTFFNFCNIQGNVQAFRLTGLLCWQKLTWFFFKICRFVVQFCFRCKFSFHEKQRSSLTVAWFFSTNHNSLLCIVTNEIASFCIEHRLHQMAFFVFAKVDKGWAKASFCVMLKYFEIKKSFMCSNLIRFHIKQMDSMLLCVCSVTDHKESFC